MYVLRHCSVLYRISVYRSEADLHDLVALTLDVNLASGGIRNAYTLKVVVFGRCVLCIRNNIFNRRGYLVCHLKSFDCLA